MRLVPLLAALSFFVLSGCGSPAATPAAAPSAPVPVRVELVAPAPLDRTLEGTGMVSAVDSAVLRPEITGLVEAVLFEDGATVKKGQALVRLRGADARAGLLDAEARAKLADLDLARKTALVERGDAAVADLESAQAAADLAKAALIRAQEAVRKTTISAPFDGVAGLREVAVGELVDPSRRVTWLESRDRLVVDLALAESDLRDVAVGQPATVQVDALPGQDFEASVSYVSPRVDEGSRTFALRLKVEDPAGLLRPGMTAGARVVTERLADALLIPTESVVRSNGGMAVYVVNAESKAELRPITPGQRTPARIQVLDGLSAGDSVVTEGLARLRPGAMVQVSSPDPAVAR